MITIQILSADSAQVHIALDSHLNDLIDYLS
jgi:hypothetical protein